ncbi:hypothetical protein CRG98_038605 [Punica granatum]|uniref:Uncharacterized protein n=1 Tax=Punica granatum TaxID=22663 RepID=A0A2I0IAQ3_PUNGR|nr:hypothetical protein CRG98_038605 [Punica granatum]
MTYSPRLQLPRGARRTSSSQSSAQTNDSTAGPAPPPPLIPHHTYLTSFREWRSMWGQRGAISSLGAAEWALSSKGFTMSLGRLGEGGQKK